MNKWSLSSRAERNPWTNLDALNRMQFHDFARIIQWSVQPKQVGGAVIKESKVLLAPRGCNLCDCVTERMIYLGSGIGCLSIKRIHDTMLIVSPRVMIVWISTHHPTVHYRNTSTYRTRNFSVRPPPELTNMTRGLALRLSVGNKSHVRRKQETCAYVTWGISETVARVEMAYCVCGKGSLKTIFG
jgi:hypothetical protein